MERVAGETRQPHRPPRQQMTNWTQSNHDPDWPIRAQALLAVERLAISTGGRIPWSEIAKGFSHRGQQIQLASRALGIFKPRQNVRRAEHQDRATAGRSTLVVP